MKSAAGSNTRPSRLASAIAALVAAMVSASAVHAAGPAPGLMSLPAASAAGTVN